MSDAADEIARLAALADKTPIARLKGKPAGRPSDYDTDYADTICELIAGGQSLRMICERTDMPHRSTVLRWLEKHDDFATKYARAREFQADAMDDKILDVAEACKPETAAADRVKIDAYKWRASKLAPKKYGDKLAVEQAVTITDLRAEELGDDDLARIATRGSGGAVETPGRQKGPGQLH